jgi:hypothetical protein
MFQDREEMMVYIDPKTIEMKSSLTKAPSGQLLVIIL